MIQLIPIGGYGEVGKNMTLIRVDNEAVIIDMGIHLPNYIKFTEDEDIKYLNPDDLRDAGAIPDDTLIGRWKHEVKAIIPTHAHLDHIGAIPFIASNYSCPIFCTRFTAEVIKTIMKDEKIKLENKINVLKENSTYQLTRNIKIEFINMTHSTPQTVCVALHTKYGIILYANDFKFDNHPTIGKKPNYKRLKKLGNKGVLLLITDSLYSHKEGKMPGELIVREMLKEVILDTDSRGKAIIISTFSSHLARLQSIIEFCRKLNRRIVFMGRSLAKYVAAGENAGLINFSKQVEIVKYSRQIRRRLKQIMKEGKEKYVLVVTGHQGEPNATLSKIANGTLQFNFTPGDYVIFSCITIPTEINLENRAILENELKDRGCSIFKDIHHSGHAGREDLRDFLIMLKPEHVIPAHSEQDRMNALLSLALEIGFQPDKVHLLNNGDILEL